MIEITRKVEFDAGHRIPDHNSKCRNVHGHRYVLECTVEGYINATPGVSDHGMIVDFGDLKAVMMRMVGEAWDHAFLVDRHDHVMIEALGMFPGHKTVKFSSVPTVENLVRIAHDLIADELKLANTSLRLVKTRLYETPNCWADVTA